MCGCLCMLNLDDECIEGFKDFFFFLKFLLGGCSFVFNFGFLLDGFINLGFLFFLLISFIC